jgi:hypothetical protein
MANKALNIKDRLAVRGAIVEPSSMIGGNYLFSLQPHIEGGNLDGALNLTSGARGSYTIETIDDPDAPYGKVVKFPTGQQSFVAAYDIDIPVDAGDRVYIEATYMIPAADTGTESKFYLGVNGLDKDKKLISSNFGLITYPVSNITLTADGNWYTVGGYATIPSSHTPYNGSDGGAVRYIKNYVLVNYGVGDREVYLSNVVVRKVEAFKDNADIYFRGNVGIGDDDPAFPLTVEGSAMFNTNTGADPFYISRLGSSTEALSIKVTDSTVQFESIQDETADNYGNFRFILDGDTSYGFLDIKRGAGGSSILHVDGSGNIGINTDSPSAPLEIANPSTEVDAIIVGRNSGNASISGGTGDGAYLILDSSGQYLSLNHYVADDIIMGNGGGDVGIGTTLPQSRLHIYTGDGGTYTPNTNHDDLTIEGSTNIGLQLFSPASTYQYIAFGDPSSVNAGYIRYYHGNNEMVFRTNGGDKVTINSTGDVRLHSYGSGSNTGTAAYTLAVDSSGNIIETSGGGGSTPTLQEVTTAGNTTTDDVGIQMSNPVSALHIGDGNNTVSSALYTTDIVNVSAQNTAPGVNIISAGTSQYNRGVFKATRAKGSLATPLTVANNDYVFSLLGAAYNGTANYATAGVEMFVDGTVSSSAVPQRIEFQTGTGTSRSARITIKSDGDVGIGTTNPIARLHIIGESTTDAVDALFVENSSGNDLFKITNSGNFYMKHATRTNSIIINNNDTTGTGASCTLIGNNAGYGTNLNGSFLTAVGLNAANNATNGGSSVAIGGYAASSCGNLFNTVAIGGNAGRNAGNAYYNVAIGGDACNGSSLRYSVAIGAWAGRGTGSSLQDRNIYIGYQTAYNSNLNDGNTVIGARLQSGSTEALSNTVIIGSDNAERLRIDSTGKFKFDSYGSGSFTGTATVNLEADSSGNVIERLEERGTFSGTTDGSGRLNISHSIGVAPTIAMITTDAVSGSTIVTASVISKSSTTVTIITNQASTTISGYYIFSE